MRVGWLFTLCALLALVALAPPALPAPLDAATGGTEAPPPEVAVTTDSWLGGLAAVGCGVFVRATIITAGTQVSTIAGAVACCAYMMIDLWIEAH